MSQAPFLSSERSAQSEWHVTQQWGALAIRHVRHVCRNEMNAEVWRYPNEHTLGLFLSPRPFKFSHGQEDRTYTGLYSQGDLLITPADTRLATQAEGDVHIIQMRLQDSFLCQVAEETLEQDGDRIKLVPAFQTRDSQVDAIAFQQATLAGMGLALLPNWLIDSDVEAGTLVNVFPDYEVTATDFHTAVWLLYPSRTYIPLKVRLFIDFLKRFIPENSIHSYLFFLPIADQPLH